jgi:hypothetical protein
VPAAALGGEHGRAALAATRQWPVIRVADRAVTVGRAEALLGAAGPVEVALAVFALAGRHGHWLSSARSARYPRPPWYDGLGITEGIP